MTPKQQKIAYSIFFSFFSVWLFSMLTGFLSPGEGTAAIAFTSQFMLGLFLSAASVTSMSSLFLGLNLLGINLRLPIVRHSGKAMFSNEEIKELRKLSPVNDSAEQNEPARTLLKLKPRRTTRQKLERGLTVPNGQSQQVPEISFANNPADQIGAGPKELEKWKLEKEKERMKAFYLFGGDTDFKQCAHEFGYLADMSASKTPIPDECFGCSKLVECVKFAENS